MHFLRKVFATVLLMALTQTALATTDWIESAVLEAIAPSLSKVETIEVDGVMRAYRIYTPPEIELKKGLPLVFSFHGY